MLITNSKKVNILVTGANGQLGSEVRVLASMRQNHNFTFVDVDQMDLSHEETIQNFFRGKHFDFIINCAAYTAVDKAEEDINTAYSINSNAVRIIASICKEKDIRLIHISTDYVFDGSRNLPISEDVLTNPLSVYGKSKLEGEGHVLEQLQNAYIIRTAWVYSTFGKNFVKTIATLGKSRAELNVVVDQIGSPTYARDLAQAILIIVDSIHLRGVDFPGIYHFSNEGIISWYDLAHFIVKFYNLPCKLNPIPSEEYKTVAVRPKFSGLDKRKIKKTFGIEVPHWHESLLTCLSELKL